MAASAIYQIPMNVCVVVKYVTQENILDFEGNVCHSQTTSRVVRFKLIAFDIRYFPQQIENDKDLDFIWLPILNIIYSLICYNQIKN